MRSRARYVLSVLVLGGLLAVIPLVSSSAGSTSATISGLESRMWSPAEVTIPPGGTVEFQVTSTTVPHGVVWGSVPETPKCEGVPINEGRTNWKGTCVFLQEGKYEFYCYVHGIYMSGKVIVSAGGTTTTTSATKSSTSTTKTSTSTTKSSTTSHTTTSSTSASSTTGAAFEPESGGYTAGGGGGGSGGAAKVFLAPLSHVSGIASTVPSNGDLNPYGIAVVPASIGKLHAGQLLISNFNDRGNEQGKGSTIVQIAPSGRRSLFAALEAHSLPGRCPGGVGLTTALGVLPHGYVVVGSLPTSNGKSATAKAGCLIVLDSKGKPVETLAGSHIDGPWDMTVVSRGRSSTLFVSNVLGGGFAKAARMAKAGGTIENGTIVRIGLMTGAGRPPKLTSERVIADRIPSRPSPEALVVGPTGLGLAHDGTLYLADTVANRITAISNAMTRKKPAHGGGRTVSKGGLLMEPLGLAIARGGDILTTNAGDGNVVETTPSGGQLLARTLDTKTGAGSLFGLTLAQGGKGVYFVDDGENAVKLLHR